jgi:hypothetical protein
MARCTARRQALVVHWRAAAPLVGHPARRSSCPPPARLRARPAAARLRPLQEWEGKEQGRDSTYRLAAHRLARLPARHPAYRLAGQCTIALLGDALYCPARRCTIALLAVHYCPARRCTIALLAVHYCPARRWALHCEAIRRMARCTARRQALVVP